MRSHFYTTSVSAWTAMFSAIQRAQESIYLEMYIFEDKTAGFDFVGALIERAHKGVQVVLVLDVYGSSSLPSTQVERLRKAGVEVLFFSYWFRRTHRKLLITDEKTAFLGGVNISQRFVEWNDLQVQVSGRVVHAITHSFARVYRASGGKNPKLLSKTVVFPRFDRARMWFVEHGLRGSTSALRTQYENHIDSAQTSIVFVSPFFVPNHWLIAGLHRALARGVSVTLLLPLNGEFRSMTRLNLYYAGIFERLGARCLFSRTMNHAKVMFVDGTVATVGSQNIDSLSFDWNIESGVFFTKPAMIRELSRIIAVWKRDAIPLGQLTIVRRWYDVMLVYLLRILQPVL
jgi:cardiolipin synthase A/B